VIVDKTKNITIKTKMGGEIEKRFKIEKSKKTTNLNGKQKTNKIAQIMWGINVTSCETPA